MKLKRVQTILITCAALTFFISLTGFSARCNTIEDSVLRLHIIANSDSEEDQALKLKVRDAVLAAGGDAFEGANSEADAEEKIEANKEALLEVARGVIKDEGYDYNVTLDITDDEFPTRTYGDVTLPAGKYRAVKMIIGEGEGHNWWCVMFPALCLPGATDDSLDAVLSKDEVSLVKSKPRYDVRFKIVELFEKFT